MKERLITLFACAAVVACGGGGGGAATPSPTPATTSPNPAPGPAPSPAPPAPAPTPAAPAPAPTPSPPPPPAVTGTAGSWVATRSVSVLDGTVTCSLYSMVGQHSPLGLVATVGFEARSWKAGTLSGSTVFPQDDIEPPLFTMFYCGTGGGSCYAVNRLDSAVKVGTFAARQLSGLNDATYDANTAAFRSGGARLLTTEQSPDRYRGLLDELANGGTLIARTVPSNQFFPTIEGTISLSGYAEMLTVFNRCSAGRPAGPP